jgi:predicted methyltransferase
VAEFQAREYHPAFEEYCEAIFELHEDDVDVIQARIAERLGVSRPAVSEMIRRMEGEGLVDLDKTITLTPSGQRLAEPWCAATGSPSASSPTSSGCRGPTPTRRPAAGST